MDVLALILVIIAGLNYGSIGFFKYDFIAAIFGTQPASVSRFVFALVGIAAIWCVTLLYRRRDERESHNV
ncbi:MAG TPA: DUF378 domain-containing protein [Terriglobales bacterium]|nr:DUF378 domain-containing protein [Terriglobales bacterium]